MTTTTTLFSKSEALATAARVGGDAIPLNPHDHEDGWYVLGERNAQTRTRSRWERGADGQPVIAGEGAIEIG